MTNDARYRALVAVLEPWSMLGERFTTRGTRLIGHVPHIAPEAYMHKLLPPLTEEGLIALQRQIGIAFHESLLELLRLHNGLHLFRDEVGVYGRRTSYRRNDSEDMWAQPYSMETVNKEERPSSAPRELLFVGFRGEDRQRSCMWPDGTICMWDKARRAPEEPTYDNVFSFLLTEAKCAASKFDSKGRQLDSGDSLSLH